MATGINQFRPDYAVPPGWIVEEYLEARGITHAEFARLCGRSAKLISEIIAGKAPVEPATALQFERVLGMDASVWLGIEGNYQLHRAREAEAAGAADSRAWLKAFPIKQLVDRGAIPRPESDLDALSSLLSFFRVGSVEAWSAKHGAASAAYRHSPSFKSDEKALATWLRLGEIEAEEQECADYDKARFKKALRRIRGFTRSPIKEARADAQQACNESGVALALVKPLPGMAVSGAARWLSPRRPVIQLSMRHKTDDHLWFSFFHEAAHILLHGKKNVFVDGASEEKESCEVQANEWASNALVRRNQWERFAATRPLDKLAIEEFADEQGIAPGIVVGMLQHEGRLPWGRLNGLKVKLKWSDDE